MTFNNNRVINNTSISGGGIYARSIDEVYLNDNTFIQNIVSNMGGACFFYRSTIL